MTRSTTIPKDFGFGENEEMLRDTARAFLDEHLPVSELRNLVAAEPGRVYDDGAPPAWDPGLWKRIVELGWPGLVVPEALGGVDFPLVGVAGLVEELGRHALPSPLIATLAAGLVLRNVDAERAGPFLGEIADGHATSLALARTDTDWAPDETEVEATPDGDGGLRLSGRSCYVQDGLKAERFVVAARAGERLVLCVVSSDAQGLHVAQDHIHDLTRDQATLRFDGVAVPAGAIVSDDAAALLRRAWPALLCLVSADLCGASEQLLQMTVEYAKTRQQFDRPIGFFQAVKHPLVDAMVGIDRARSLLYHAAALIDAGDADAPQAARMAKSAASDAAEFVSHRAVQLHGGIGFTWESDVHLYFKRNLHNQVLLGDGPHQRRLLADPLIGPIGVTTAGA